MIIMMIIIVVTKVDTNVEVLVVPIRFVIAAPLSISVHLGDVGAHLPALLAVAAGVAVDHARGCYVCSRRPGIPLSQSTTRPQITIHLSLQMS